MSDILSSNNKSLTSNSLHDLIGAGYQRNKKAEEVGFKHGVQLDHELSNSNHKVFVDPDKHNSTVVFTGSRKASDWLITDPAIALGLGKYTKRYKDSQKLISKVKDKYSDSKITTTGHSLGGYLAENVKADKKYTVNKATGIDGIGKKINKNQTDIVVKGDIVSPLAYTQKHKGKFIKIENSSINPIVSHKYSHLKKINI